MTNEEQTKRALEIQNGLAHYTGTELWHRHSMMRNVLYTDGVKYLADAAASYWLIDKVASLQLEPKIKAEPFQSWKLTVKDGAADLVCTDGGKEGDKHVELHREHITFTDFPLDSIELWVEEEDGRAIILLPREH